MQTPVFILFSALLIGTTHDPVKNGMSRVEGGRYVPMYGAGKNETVTVGSFEMDKLPVTNADFMAFVKQHPRWRKSAAPKLFADAGYLKNWTEDLSFPPSMADAPVTNISWFAAKAYCECQGKRLPTTHEWEFAAMAGYKYRDERRDSLFSARILAAYETPKTYLKPVGQSRANYWGLYNLNELVWEWTSDFGSVMMSGENRSSDARNLFCGAGSLNATDLMNYAAFMRYAFRSSIQARFTINNLGFRCAR